MNYEKRLCRRFLVGWLRQLAVLYWLFSTQSHGAWPRNSRLEVCASLIGCLNPVCDAQDLTPRDLERLHGNFGWSKMADTAIARGVSMPEISGNKAKVTRRRRRQSAGAEKNIEDDVLMASTIGDVAWLQQSLRDGRKVYSHSKQHVSATPTRHSLETPWPQC